MVLVRPVRHLNIIEPSPTPPPMVPLCASVVREKVLYFRLLTISVFQYLFFWGFCQGEVHRGQYSGATPGLEHRK